MHVFLDHLARKSFRNRTVGLIENGSWAPVAGKLMCDMLSGMKGMTVLDPVVTLRSRLHNCDLPVMRQLARAVAGECR